MVTHPVRITLSYRHRKSLCHGLIRASGNHLGNENVPSSSTRIATFRVDRRSVDWWQFLIAIALTISTTRVLNLSKKIRKFNQFLKLGVRAASSTLHFHGHAEAAVKTMKTLIATTSVKGDLDDENFQQGFLHYRNTPRAGGLSPCTNSLLTSIAISSTCTPAIVCEQVAKTADEQDASCRQAHARNEERYNRQSRPPPQIRICIQVILQNPVTKKWDRVGMIIGIGRLATIMWNCQVVVCIGATATSWSHTLRRTIFMSTSMLNLKVTTQVTLKGTTSRRRVTTNRDVESVNDYLLRL